MSKELKASVLAKCGDATKESKYASDNDLDWDLIREDDAFKLEAWNGSISLNFCDKDDEDHEIWPLAAQILGIQDSQAEQDKALADEVIWKESEVSAGHMSSEIRLTLTATCNPLEVFEAIERLCK